jgi:predicted dehydrogenase
LAATRPLKVAVVGCGQIADAHLQELGKLPGTVRVAVCDRNRDLAERDGAVYGVSGVYDDLDLMLAEARPDLVHVCTPAGTHRPLAIACLEAGCHVYVEKPFTVAPAEARQVLDTARRVGRLVCVGHNELFDQVWRETCSTIRSGRLGEVVFVDSVQGYDLSGPFGSLLVSQSDHWVRRLPGGFFHNTISHPVYKITEFLDDPAPAVWATWFAPHPAGGFPTELRVVLVGERVSANLTVSSAARPVQRVVKICGTRESCEVDLEGRTVRRIRGATVRGPFVSMQAPLRQMTEGAARLGFSLRQFLRNRIHYFGGLRTLFEEFQRAIVTGGAPPIAYDEIERVTAIMDTIFAVADGKLPQGSRVARLAPSDSASRAPAAQAAPPPAVGASP